MDNTNEQINNAIQQNAKESQFTVASTTAHTHNGTDSLLITTVDLPIGTPIKLGLGGMISFSKGALGSVAEQVQTSIVSGKDQAGGTGNTTGNLQFNLLHQPKNASNQSFINAFRPPVFGNILGTTISTTLGGNTVTTVGYNFTANSLVNALINIFNASGTLIETQVIASNTTTVITIVDTWLATTTGGTLFIFQPVFLGSADTPFQRVYTSFTTGGGFRFGVGPTNGGQNSLLYSIDGSDLYYRKSNGISIRIV